MSYQLTCTNLGRVGTRMWTEGKVYPATQSGVTGGNLTVIDDLGHTKIMRNQEFPRFPMGTSGYHHNLVTYTAFFYREELP